MSSLTIRKKASFKFNIFLVGVFSLFRVYRNSFGYNNTGIGGIWNIISLVFMILSILFLFCRKYKFGKPVLVACLYSMFAILNALLNINSLSVSLIYNILMIGYFAYVIICFCSTGQEEISRSDAIFAFIVFLSVCLVCLIGLFKFRTGQITYVMISNVYYPLCLLPMIMFVLDNKRLKTIAFLIVGIVVLVGMKRTGFIAYALFLVIVLYC